MPNDFVSDYEEVTGQSRDDAFADAAPVAEAPVAKTKVVSAPKPSKAKASTVEVETA